ncbi:MAG: PQQ-binding-like beta-propeller repeat protein, partial [Planctomycetia bacterium]|nr:PQQ-binding-like beta-propeller repeat protein [Planctomycetia bacterium]
MARTLRKVLWMVARSASVLLLALAVHAPADDIAPLDDPAADDALVAPGDDPTIDEIVDEIAAQAARFIDQWREASFARREQAGAELAELGLAARGPLLAALRDSDPEVRLRARRCLAKIVEDDFEARLAAFAADAHGTGRHDLPGWERFRVIAGGDEPPRKLFIEMLRAEGTLLETAEHAGPELVAETLALRCQQLQQLQSAADPAVRRGPSLASVAALLFVCGTPRLKAPDNVSGLIYNYVMQAPFQQALRGEYGVPLNKLVADWMVQPSSMSLAYQKVNLGIRFHVRECLHPAGQLVADRQTSPYMRMYGLLALAKYGGREHVGWLLTALDDKALCSQRVRAANGQQQQVFRGEVRDFALLALVRITGQRPADYGLGGVLDNPYSVYNTTSVGFASDEERTAALEKWKKWIADNPTPPSAPAPPALLPTNNAVRVARQAAPLADPTGAEDDAPVFVADREMRVRLTRALLMLETGRIGEACQLLDELLSADGGSAFRPERDHPIDRSVAAEALAIIATLAPEARQAYELHVGTEARKQLDEAVAKGDARRMAQVARRYFHSAAGQEAALLWSDWLLDAGQPHAAAVVLKRLRQAPDAVRFEPTLSQQRAVCLLRAGLAEEADAALAILNPDARDEAIRAAGASEVGLRRNDNQWLLFRADARRSGRAQAAAPWLRTAWRVDAAELPATREAMFRLVDAYRRQHLAVLPAASPIAADGKIIARTTGELLAIDSATGKLVWSVPLSNSVDELITDRGLQAAGAPQLLRGLDDRLFLDQTHGTLSSDGKSVFGVEDVGFAYGLLNQRNSVGPDGSRRLDPGWPQSFNRLTSYDVATGKLQWEIGGPQAELALPLAGTFFLGPPLPLGDRLFAVAERSGHIELMTLEKATGDLLAEQALAPLDASLDVISGAALQLLDQRPSRRLCGASPSYSDGILVCPTSPDNFVAVDLTTGRIVWAYLPLEPDEAPRGRVGVLAALAAAPALPEPASRDARWADCSVTIADGRALLTPASADRLYCLELTTGKRLWTALRLDGQYVAGALRGIVLVVGRGKVFGLSLETGKLAWEPTPLPPGSAPSGRGLFSGGRFLLPLSTAEIAIVDVASGKIVQRSRRTEGDAPGNLVASGGRVISQTAYGVEAFSRL